LGRFSAITVTHSSPKLCAEAADTCRSIIRPPWTKRQHAVPLVAFLIRQERSLPEGRECTAEGREMERAEVLDLGEGGRVEVADAAKV
jgi:hypothetical protein